MHTSRFRICGTRWSVIHNGDYSGSVTIRSSSGAEFNVPAELLLRFAAEVVRSERIADTESASEAELLGLRRFVFTHND